MSFIIGVVSSASVVADTHCSIMALDRSKLELLLFNEPKIAAALYRFIAKLLRNRILENQLARNKKAEQVATLIQESEKEEGEDVDLSATV